MPRQGAIVHPGRLCGPCSLCGQKSAYYTHPSSWKEGLQQNCLYDLEQVGSQSCVCKACAKDIKRHITTAGYIPRWRINTGINIDKCIVPGCSITSDSGLIIHTGLVSTQQVASLLGIPLPQTSEGKLTPLCQGHYKHIHRLLHADDSMYKHEKGFTCNVILKGPSRCCPNPTVIKQNLPGVVMLMV